MTHWHTQSGGTFATHEECAHISSVRNNRSRLKKRLLFLPILLVLMVFTEVFGNWIALPLVLAASNHALKGAPTTPNIVSATTGAASHTRPYTPGVLGNAPAHAPVTIGHTPPLPMKAGSLDLQVNQASRFVGSDGRLELQIPAGAITAQDLAAAGGKITMHVTQITPASGSSAGGSGEISFGTYLVQLVDVHGKLLTHGLRKALTALYHLQKGESGLHVDHALLLLNGAVPASTTQIQGVVQPATGTSLTNTMGTRQTQKASLDKTGTMLAASPLISTPSSSMSFDSSSPVATFGKPDPTSVDLSAGALSYSQTIDVPDGPGGLTPPITLAYSSEAVNEQHNASGAAGWVGEGWSLSMGAINWSEQNVTAGCSTCTATWDSSWQLSDPYGTSSELIPPDAHTSTYYDDSPNFYCATGGTPSVPCPILWHTATESHAKIYAYVGPVNIGEPQNPPCFRVWLPNGIMEEFGCTSDSLQYYYEAGLGAEVSGWYLDLITDPQGNQIHFTYQSDMENWTSPSTGTVYSYPRDVQLASIQYDSPGCLNAQSMCTGSSWAPLMQVVFNASHSVSNLTGVAPTGCNTGANMRCDDPIDLSGSNGTSTSLIQSTFVLNSIQVQVRASGTGSWNTVRTYQLSYEQSGPTTSVDPASGLNRSTAGMLDLTQIQQVGSGGATALMYSGMDNSSSSSFAYSQVFDLSGKNITVGSNTTLSYWIYPQSSTANGAVSGDNSTCVAIDMIFTDGSDLRDSGAVDQNGNQLHPAHQCGHLTLDQWNLVTSDIGAKVNGKTINRIDVGYDQPANTGGYRGYIDDISLTNPTSGTPLFATGFESGDPQPSWTNTIDSSGGGGINNVGGFCCGLNGPEMGTRQEIVNADSAAQPPVRFTYTTLTNYYEDSFYTPTPTTNCGPSWNTGNGSGCLLWQQSYAGNSRFLTSISNGLGLLQNFSYVLARSNSHGVPGGGSNNADPLYCNSHQSGYPCNEADDSAWSHVVLSQESSTTIRLTQNGQGGAQTSTPVTSTTGYTYQLTYPLTAQQCSDCVAGMYWGDQNDADYLNYYNATFMGFAQATVNLPDGAVEVHKFYAGEGWGLYDTSQVQCFSTGTCHNSPWWDLANTAHGREYQAQYYDTNGTTLLKQVNSTFTAVCPPSGVSGTPNFDGFSFDGQLISELSKNNPVAVCDIQQTQQTTQTYDGASNPVTTTSNFTYDSFGRVTQETTTTNGGTPSTVVHNTAYVWNDGVTATQNSASGTYLIDIPAFSDTEDGSGNRTQCSYTSYDGQAYTTGQTSTLTGGLATTHDTYTNCGTSANNYTPSGKITTTDIYNASGQSIATDDADANAGISGHTGCSVNSVSYTDCTTYDGTYNTLPITSTNTLGQVSSTSYSQTALGGFGLWSMSTTDFNGQVSTYAYDALGRMVSSTLPNESTGNVTKSWSFTSWCSGTAAQAPCMEIDETDRLDSTTTVVNRAFYDGYGRLVETRSPGPNNQDVVVFAFHDAAGHMIFESSSYFVPAYTGPAGAAAYSLPDTTQPGTSTVYDGLERVKSVTNAGSQTTTTSYSVVCGVAAYNDNGCYEQTAVIDGNAHEQSTLTSGLGNVAYDVRYTGNSSNTYTSLATTAYLYDTNGMLVTIRQPASGATTTFTFDAAGRKIGQTDPDRGSESYTYDPNGNLVQSVDARGSAGTVYAGYDGLNRLLWRNTTNSPTGARVTYTYDSTANGNVGIGRLTGESFTGSGGMTGSYAYTYDQRGQQVGLTVTVNGTNYTEQKTYDDASHVISETYPTGETVQVGYTAQGWLSGLTTTVNSTTTTLASNLAFTGAAGAAGQITGMNLGNGVYSYSANYDVLTRLTSASISRVSNGQVLFQTQDAYDGVSNVVSTQTTLPDGTDNQAFCYNEQNQLTWAGATGNAPCGSFTPGTLTSAQYQQSYSYDLNGRLSNGPLGTYTYGSSPLHAVTSTSSGYTAAYDAAGNMICRAPTSATTCTGSSPTGQVLSYDAEGNLSSWGNQPTPTTTANYLYDGSGNRVAMQTTSNGTTVTTAYIDDIEEVQSTSGGSGTTAITYYYVGSNMVAEAVNGVFSYLGTDRLGSPLIALDSAGSMTAEQLYAPYGTSRYANGIMPGTKGFTGQRADSVTGLDYYVSRYYDPSLGQFISPDTALPASGYNPWGLSRYAYVQGNPETMTDPDGHCWPLCAIIIGAVVGAAIGAGISIATQAASGHGVNWGAVGRDAASGAVSGAIAGLAGPEAGYLVHAAVGAASGAAGQVVNNLIDHKPLGDGVLTAALIGGVTGVAAKGAGQLIKRFGGKFMGSVAKEAETCGLSFSANTSVATPTGEQPISNLHVGDQVKTYDPATKQVSTQTIQQVFINHDTDLINVTLAVQASPKSATPTKQQKVAVSSHGSHAPPSGTTTTTEVVHTTQNHPWLTTKGWVIAGELHLGDQVQQLDGTAATVIALTIISGVQDMYDLSVSNVHTFAVGDGQFVVHNCGEVRALDEESYHQANSSGGGKGGKSPFDLRGKEAQDALDSAIPNKSGRHLVTYTKGALYIFKHELTQTITDDSGNKITRSIYHGYRVLEQDLTKELENNTTQSIRRQLVSIFNAPRNWLKGAPWRY